MINTKFVSYRIKVIFIVAISADGRIAESQEQLTLSWTSKDDTVFFVRKTRELGALVMGRKTFETIGKPLDGRLTVVMTKSPEAYTRYQEDGVLEFTDMPPAAILENLSKRGYSAVAVVGGSLVYSCFLRDGLVDEIYLTIEPVMFGRGILFAEEFEKISMRLLDVSRLGKHSVLIHYGVAGH